MIGAMGQPDGLKLGFGAVESVALAGKFQRRCHVFQRGHRGDQVKGLKNDAHVIAAEPGQRIFVHRGQIPAQRGDCPARRLLQPAHQHQERGFARAGRADQAQRFATKNIKGYAMQDIHPTGIAIQRQSRILEGKDCFGHEPRIVSSRFQLIWSG